MYAAEDLAIRELQEQVRVIKQQGEYEQALRLHYIIKSIYDMRYTA